MNLPKKELIKKAAIEVISREGFHHATSDKIAVEAGVSVGTIYYYFDHKEDILAYIIKGEGEKRFPEICKLKQANMHPLDKIIAIARYHFKLVGEDHKVAKIIHRERHLPFIIPDGIKKVGGIPRFLEEIIADGVEAGHIRKCDVQIIAITIFGIIEGAVGWYILEKEMGKESDVLNRALVEIDSFLWCGLPSAGKNIKCSSE